MTSETENVETVIELPTFSRRRRRVASRDRTDSSSDVILVDSPSSPPSARFRRRRRRMQNSDIVDLTCTSTDDAAVIPLVDLTSPAHQTSLRTQRNSHKSIQSNDRQSPPTEEATVLQVKCPVCLEHLDRLLQKGTEIRSTNCGHVFCKPCITTCIRTTHKCPTCRKKLTERTHHPLYLPIS